MEKKMEATVRGADLEFGSSGVLGFRDFGFRHLGFRELGCRELEFRV